MDDLVERAKAMATALSAKSTTKAVDEIAVCLHLCSEELTRLREENKRLREALKPSHAATSP